MSATTLASAVEALVGSPFRLHGRDPATGLDCIGVLVHAMKSIELPVVLPDAYPVRSSAAPAIAGFARDSGFAPATGDRVPGDVLFAQVGPVQYHLLIVASDGRCVHAHAGLGRVVIGELPATWKVVGHWRLDTNCQG